MPGLIIALVMALSALGGGVVYASQHALTADALYRVGTTVESVPLAPATTDASKTRPLLDLAAKRVPEARLPQYTDAVSNTLPISSTVSVTFTQAISNVENLATDENIPGESYKGLLAKLGAAHRAVERGQEHVAENVLNAFLNELNAMMRSGHISGDNYHTLYSDYTALVTGLGGTPTAETDGDQDEATTAGRRSDARSSNEDEESAADRKRDRSDRTTDSEQGPRKERETTESPAGPSAPKPKDDREDRPPGRPSAEPAERMKEHEQGGPPRGTSGSSHAPASPPHPSRQKGPPPGKGR